MTYIDDCREHALELVRGFLSNIDDSSGLVIIQNTDGALPKEVLTEPAYADSLRLFTCAPVFLGNYFPFLQIIQEAWESSAGQLSLREFLPRHQGLIRRQLEKLPGDSPEEVLLDEWDFEHSRMQRGIRQTAMHCCRGKLLVLQAAQHLTSSSLGICRQIADSSSETVVLVTSGVSNDDLEADWNALMEAAEERDAFLLLPSSRIAPAAAPSLPADTCAAADSAKTALSLFAAREAQQLFQALLHEHEAGIRTIPDHVRLDIYLQLGRIAYFAREWDDCIARLQHMSALAQRLGSQPVLVHAYWRMGVAFQKKDDLQEAERMSLQARKIADQHQLPVERFYADFLYFQIEDQRRFQSIPEFETFFTDLLDRARELGFENTYAFIATNPFGLYSAYSRRIAGLHADGLQTAARLQNDWRLAEAHQTMGLAYAVQGDYPATLAEYSRSREIRVRLGEPIGLAAVSNGMGYYQLMQGDYQAALDDFHQAMQYLRETREYHEIAMTLFNMALCSLLSLQFSYAATLLQHCSRLMRVMNRENLAYHSRFGILCLHGLAFALAGSRSKAQRLLNQISLYGFHPYQGKNEEFFWHELLQAVLAPAAAAPHLAAAEDYLFRTNDRIDYMAPFFFYILSQLDIYPARNLQRCGVQAAERHNRFYQAAAAGSPPPINPPHEDDLGWILMSARMQRSLVHLHRQVSEIRFLSDLQDVLANSESVGELTDSITDRIYSSFPFAAVYFFSVSPEEEIQLAAYRGRDATPDPQVPQLLPAVDAACQDQRIVTLPDGSSVVHLCIGTVPDILGRIWCIPENPAYLERVETLQILAIATRQLAAALSRIQQQETIVAQWQELKRKNILLEKLSTTDPLTNLGNRTALYKTLHSEVNRIIRYGRNSVPCSVMFIDLDNFKLINDTLGHAAGDYVLARTAHLILSELRDTDQAFRYGGDEFVVVLPETPAENCRIVAGRIHQRMAEARGFSRDLAQELQLDVPPALKEHLSLSIGITAAESATAGFDPEILLDQADRALYAAKRAGKDQSLVFTIDSDTDS
ncbi:tetratricopeptide repeat-containing diguanylate cyclase [Spirochaeta africana]|uniref:diguanylate cyclase n=1 Tax=Spirochaeta africana (strain ATCC 700263 / DSM 8902 / Z-7692) TaxID=889378 RepID=H9ULF9_SPIAZ|nr:tetratricopeptide repeat-containing diguanylate cyclase [Spirochaeta africana]AFG38352.1 diguanylate cyclase (GGDEF) domain-containing protein [Spirochaeta africana DSM 8902]